MHMSKLTTRGNRRIAAKIDVMTANKRTVGATNYTASSKDMKGKSKADQSKPVPGRNVGKKGETKGKGKGAPPPFLKGGAKKKAKKKAKK